MRVLVAMSGGVDSSVAAALELEAGHEVLGATMKLWGGPSDSGCCSVADVTDARRVCDALGIEHLVFNFTESFEAGVVRPYVEAHAAGRTPNPCVECNRRLKFDALLSRAERLGFDAVATGHHARLSRGGDGRLRVARGADARKDQSYVLAVLPEAVRDRVRFPVGDLNKDEVRARAAALGLRTAAKPDSQDVCFIPSATSRDARRAFLGERIALHPGRVVDDRSGEVLGGVDAVELVTVGQRRGLGAATGTPRYAVSVDVASAEVRVGGAEDLLASEVALDPTSLVGEVPGRDVGAWVQVSAHGAPRPARLEWPAVLFDRPERRVAPGQLVAWYVGDEVIGSASAR